MLQKVFSTGPEVRQQGVLWLKRGKGNIWLRFIERTKKVLQTRHVTLPKDLRGMMCNCQFSNSLLKKVCVTISTLKVITMSNEMHSFFLTKNMLSAVVLLVFVVFDSYLLDPWESDMPGLKDLFVLHIARKLLKLKYHI